VKRTWLGLVALAVAAICLFAVNGYAQDSSPEYQSAISSTDGKLKPPPPAPVAGAWCGTVQDNLVGTGQINLAIKQKKQNLSGTWTDEFGGFGTLTGKIVGDAVSVKLKDKASKCKLAVNGTLEAPNELSGTYSQFGCKQADSGSFDIESPGC
jgi:hypothetical protein